MKIPVIAAQKWNQLVADIQRGTPLEGGGCKIIRTPEGAMVSARGAADWHHPWKLSARWQPAEKAVEGMPPGEWRVFVNPGFVNGRDATIAMNEVDPNQTGDVPLTNDPRPYLAVGGWRNPLKSAGLAATLSGELLTLPAEGYPPFFKKLGVREADPGSRGTEAATPDSTRTRELRACDIALITPRISVRTEITVLDPFADQQVVDMNSAFDDTAFRRAKSAFRLAVRAKWEPPQEPTMLDRLLGTAVEPQTDEIKIATLWIVSPPDAGTDAIPDGTWQPYPQHFVFWNLAHEARRPPPETPFQPLRFFLPLAGGVAQPVVDSILAPINDAYAAIHNALKETTFKGEFWTI